MFCAALIAGLYQLLSTTLEIQFTREFQVLIGYSVVRHIDEHYLESLL